MLLQSRLRPLPRRHHNPDASAVPAPDLKDGDQSEEEESSEDIFGAYIAQLFPDDAPPFHGDPGQHLLYASPSYGDLEIMVPSYPTQSKDSKEVDNGQKTGQLTASQIEEGRMLFAHFVWDASIVVAEGVENANLYAMEPTAARKEAYDIWNVMDQSVLELGAGAALPSLVSALSNASTVVATDHPFSSALTGAIEFNMRHNLSNRSPVPPASVSIQPHEWGVLDDTFSLGNKGAFTRIIAADCYWMRSQHENLARTMQWFLAPGGQVWVVAAFHTGRAIVAAFFETALENGFKIERIFERDVVSRNEDGKEIRREWLPEREGEGVENRRRWCVVAVLKRDD